MKERDVLVVFGDELPPQWRRFDTVVASPKLRQAVEAHGSAFVDLDTLCGPGSIYEASALLEELSYMKMPGGIRIAKSFVYKGFELWWVHYENLFRYFCLPYTQYKSLLEYIKDFRSVSVYHPPHKNLFSCYLEAHGKKMTVLEDPGDRGPSSLPFGVLLQIIITLLSLPVLAVQRRRTMVYTGDKFEKDKDYDFRMRFIYTCIKYCYLHSGPFCLVPCRFCFYICIWCTSYSLNILPDVFKPILIGKIGVIGQGM